MATRKIKPKTKQDLFIHILDLWKENEIQCCHEWGIGDRSKLEASVEREFEEYLELWGELSSKENNSMTDKIIKWAKKNHKVSSHYKENFSNERIIETTVNYDELLSELEQIKEQTNE